MEGYRVIASHDFVDLTHAAGSRALTRFSERDGAYALYVQTGRLLGADVFAARRGLL